MSSLNSDFVVHTVSLPFHLKDSFVNLFERFSACIWFPLLSFRKEKENKLKLSWTKLSQSWGCRSRGEHFQVISRLGMNLYFV